MKRRDAMRTLGSVSALAVGGIGAKAANAKASKLQAKKSNLTTSALSKAWASYYAAIDEMRALIEATSRYQKYPRGRAKAYHVMMAMQAMTYNFAIAPRMSIRGFFATAVGRPINIRWDRTGRTFAMAWRLSMDGKAIACMDAWAINHSSCAKS